MSDNLGPDDQPVFDLADSRLAMFIKGAPFAVAMFDREMRYVAWSGMWAQRYGTGDRDLAGRSHYEVFPDLSPHLVEAYRRALGGEDVACEEDRIEVSPGKVHWERWHIQPIRDPAGEVGGITLYTEDISDQVRAREQLRESELRLRLMIDSVGIGTIETDLRNGTSVISRTFRQMSGLNEQDLPSGLEGLIKALKPPPEEAFGKALTKALDPAGDGLFRTELQPEVTGLKRDMQLVGKILFDEGADTSKRTPTRFVGILIDRTERNHLQSTLARSQRLEAVGKIAGIIAHDFNNLLSVILANLELAAMRVSDRTAYDYLQAAMDAAEMGGSFNKKLLALAGKQDPQPVTLHLDEHILKTWAMLERLLNERISLHFLPGADDFCVRIDPAELDGAILNLVVNARDAQPQGGEITIATQRVDIDEEAAKSYEEGRPGIFLELSVSDKGVGMTQQEVLNAREPFVTTKGPEMGTGLGLTSVAASVARVDGFLTIDSEKGVGTRVSLFLPLADGVASRQEQQEMTPQGNGELVLVVEDDPLVREATLKRLEALGYAVLEASTGESAMQLLEEGEPVELVFSDVVLPGDLSGYDVVRRVCDEFPGVAVLLTSGHVSKRKYPAGDVGPIPELLAKPYALPVLAQAVRRALSQRAVKH